MKLFLKITILLILIISTNSWLHKSVLNKIEEAKAIKRNETTKAKLVITDRTMLDSPEATPECKNGGKRDFKGRCRNVISV